MNQRTKKSKEILLLLLLTVFVLLVIFYFNGYLKNSKKVMTSSNEKKEKVEIVSKETKNFQDVLDSMKSLFKNGNPNDYRTDISEQEFKTIEQKINKIEDNEAKKNLQTKLDEIKSHQNIITS